MFINQIQNYNTDFRASKKVSYKNLSQSKIFISALQEVNPNLQKLNQSTRRVSVRQAFLKMKEMLGLEKVFEDGGLSIVLGDKILKLSSPVPFCLNIREDNINNKQDFKYVELQEDNILSSHGFKGANKDSIDDFLTSAFEQLDFPILQLRRFLRSTGISELLKKISPKAVLDEQTAKVTDDIRALFYEIQGRISSVKNMVSRSKIKNSYPNAKPSIHGSKQLEFTNVGPMSEDFSVNIITIATNLRHLVIKTSQLNSSEPQVIIVDPKYRVLKEKNLGKVYHLGSSAVYYSQREIDSPLFISKLETLKKELEKYNSYLEAAISKFNAYKAHLSTDEIGIIDKKTLKLIKDVKVDFDACKAKMLKIKDAPRKNAYKQKYNIETRDGSPSLIFRDINEDHEKLHLSFPVMAGEQCMKIIIEKQNGNIGKSLFVNGDKLVKFNASSLGRSKRTDTDTNYHSQAEIDSSGLHDYLKILKKRLSVIEK